MRLIDADELKLQLRSCQDKGGQTMTQEKMENWSKEREYNAMRDKRPAAQETEQARKHLVSLLMMGSRGIGE